VKQDKLKLFFLIFLVIPTIFSILNLIQELLSLINVESLIVSKYSVLLDLILCLIEIGTIILILKRKKIGIFLYFILSISTDLFTFF
jgi:hypothetical protein